MTAAKVIRKEQDLSTRVDTTVGVYGAIVIPAKKGSTDEPVLVTSETQFLKLYTPDERVEVGYDLSYFSALSFLEQSNKLWVMRSHNQSLFAGALLRRFDSDYDNNKLAAGLEVATTFAFDALPDAEPLPEITEFTASADVAGSLGGKYFTFEKASGQGFYVWFNTGSSVDPAPAGLTGVSVTIAENAAASTVANACVAALQSTHGGEPISGEPSKFRIVNQNDGAVTSSAAGTSGFLVVQIQEGTLQVISEDELMLIYGSSQGAWGDKVGIKVTNYTTAPDTVKEEGAFLIEVFKSSNVTTPVESFICSRDEGARDGYNNNIFVENVLEQSEFIRAINNPSIEADVRPKDQTSILWLGGGDDGLAVADGGMMLAAQKFANPEEMEVTLLMDGGFATPAYGQYLDLIAEQRDDCVALLSTPFVKEASANYLNDIIDYRKTELTLNSSRSALYTPHKLVYDKFNDRKVYISPDADAAGVISKTATNFEIWYPPAGWNRGALRVLDLKRKFSTGEQDALYEAGVNFIKFSASKGIALFGQKTLLTRPSALDRLNVRLLLIVIKPAIAFTLEDFLFEFNDETTRSRVSAIIESYLENIQARRGITEFKVVCDETNNTPARVASNELVVDIFIKPTKSAEFIPFTTTLTPEGVSLS
jgi:hypothetical protein